jgi:hypothetical protein
MAYEKKDLTGALFINGRKEKDTHPDKQGWIMIDGQEYWLNGWDKTKPDGEEWTSLSLKKKDGAPF